MTWLRGSSTWGTLDYDLTRLICGEVADGQGATNSTPWIREFTRTVTDLATTNASTTVTSATAAFVAADVGLLVIGAGIPANTTIASVTNGTTAVLSAAATATASGVTAQLAGNTIRTPASKDVASGAMSNRTGYFSLLGQTNNALLSPLASVCRVTSPFTTDPSTSGFHRWFVFITVNAANTVAGNYSTASLRGYIYDLDSGANIVNSAVLTPNAAGLTTVSNGLQVTVSDPSGILTVGTQWVRGFTSTYMYGVDLWPMLHRASGSSTFSAAPPGAAGTDYDVVSLSYSPISTGLVQDRGNLLHGLGIKTATANTGALYTVSFPMALIKARIFNGPTAGTLSLDIGQSKRDAVNGLSTWRALGGYRITTWAKAWTTAASVTAASAVQYFLSVTAGGIVLVLNADPAQTGKLGTAFLAAFTPNEPTYDVFPVAFNVNVWDYSGDQVGNDFAAAVQYPYFSLRRRQDGSEGTRDWQTRWMRAEHLYNGGVLYGGMSPVDSTTLAVNNNSTSGFVDMLTAIGASTSPFGNPSAIPARQNKPGPDGKWWMYGCAYGEGQWTAGSAPGLVDENRITRGQQTSRYAFIPGDNWGSGDELTDTGTGTKYLLVMPDFAGLGGRSRTAASTYFGGLAIAEL